MANASNPSNRRRIKWGRIGLCALLVVFALLISVFLWLAVAGNPEKQFRISPETTVLTKPLTREGLVDYVEELRQRNHEAAPADANASRLLVEAIGQFPFGTPERFHEACVETGIAPLPATGDYIVRLYLLAETIALEEGTRLDLHRYGDLENSFDVCRQTPWSAADSQDLARWLADNEAPLAKVRAASLMPHYREPVVMSWSGAGYQMRLLTITGELRGVSRLLFLRAMLRLNEGDAAAAWDDILTVHRLSRLVAQGNCQVEYHVGCSIAGEATDAMQHLVSSAQMTPELLATIERDWRGLSAWPDPVPVVDVDERYKTLDLVQRTARFGPADLNEMIERGVVNGRFSGHGTYRANPLMTRAINACVDWDQVMIETNEWYDRASDVLEETDPARRGILAVEFQRDVGQLELNVQSGWFPSTSRVGGMILMITLPDIERLHQSITSRDARDAIVDTALAIERFRFDTDRVPAALAELVPNYLDAVPLDPHLPSDEVNYVTQGDGGYVLYSVGDDDIDDGGLAEDKDITFRVRMLIPDPAASSQVQ